MGRIWLFFAQCVTVALAILFLAAYFEPSLLDRLRFFPSPKKESSTTTATIGQKAAPQTSPAFTGPVPSFRQAVERASPAVVSIFTTQKVSVNSPFSRNPFFNTPFGDRMFPNGKREIKGLGSGVIIESQGLILTNNHVVESADEIEIALADGRTFKPELVGADPDTDLAVLRIKEAKNLPTVAIGRSEDLFVGDIVLAIGNPFGVGQTVTMGIVSALGRTKLGINTYERFIQTDAAINPGNSGGPLIDLNGNLIGINAAIFSESGGSLGIGFAIPVEMARDIVKQITENGQVIRGWLGAEVAPITPEIKEAYRLPDTSGVMLGGLFQDGPAALAGLRSGDVIVGLNDKKITEPNELINGIAALSPGTETKIDVYREGKILEYRVKIGKRPPQKARR